MLAVKSIGERMFDIFNVILMALFAVSVLYPFINILAISLSGEWAVTKGLVTVYPINPTIKAYKDFLESNILLGYANSLRYTVLGTFWALFMCSLTAYPLADSSFSIRTPILVYITFTMFFSGGLIPWYMVIKRLGMVNNMWGIIIPAGISAYNIIVLRTFFQQLPDSLKDAALIDGANDLIVFTRIFLPLSKAALATVGLWIMVGHWNSFFAPFILLSDPRKFPIQLIVAAILRRGEAIVRTGTFDKETMGLAEQVAPNTYRSAAIIASSLPIIIVYPFLQRYFVKGVMIGSIKA